MNLPSGDLKSRLRAGEVIGCHWLSLGSAALAELAAEAGAEAVVIDMQHGLWDRAGLEAAIGATRGGAIPLVRTADQSATSIGIALDAGAHGVIAPLVDSAEQCAAVVDAALYPPRGRRSGGGLRPMIDIPAYRAAVADHLLVAVMIETALGVEAAEEIAGTPGLDLIFIGSGDLALSVGESAGAPVFEAALARVLKAGRSAGVAVGIFTPSLDDALARAAQGFQFVVFANDVELNLGRVKALWDRFELERGGQSG